jgi:predicted DNA-binding transcriptional regulator YafY
MLKTDTDRRAWLIELISYWEGGINATGLAALCGIGRQQATKDLSAYRERFSTNLSYSPSLKTFQPTSHFICGLISGDVAEYLDWVSGQRAPTTAGSVLPYQCLRHPPRKVAAPLMRKLIQAIREQRRIEVDYVSLSNPDHEGRVIVPHTFVNAGLRWHLRAWCEKSRDYRDFVLSRFRGEAELLDLSFQGVGQDVAWQTQIELILAPDPRLSPAKRNVIEQDYAMANGGLQLSTRAALANYLLQEMQVNYKMLDGTPEAQQLILVNLDEVRQWLF